MNSKVLRRPFVAKQEIEGIESFIKSRISESGANGVVIGLSGGIDSSVVAALCKKALGTRRVLGVFLFEDDSIGHRDYIDAKQVAKLLGLKTIEIRLTPIINTFLRTLISKKIKPSRLTLANIKARCRMVTLYSIANQNKLLVAGTGDRSELLIGYFTKFGDGGVDMLPIGHLYKTEVRALGSTLRLPVNVVTKPSSPSLWKGHTAAEELPLDYDVLDRVLTLLYDSKKNPKQVAKQTGVPLKTVHDVIERNIKSRHKRELPPSLA